MMAGIRNQRQLPEAYRLDLLFRRCSDGAPDISRLMDRFATTTSEAGRSGGFPTGREIIDETCRAVGRFIRPACVCLARFGVAGPGRGPYQPFHPTHECLDLWRVALQLGGIDGTAGLPDSDRHVQANGAVSLSRVDHL